MIQPNDKRVMVIIGVVGVCALIGGFMVARFGNVHSPNARPSGTENGSAHEESLPIIRRYESASPTQKETVIVEAVKSAELDDLISLFHTVAETGNQYELKMIAGRLLELAGNDKDKLFKIERPFLDPRFESRKSLQTVAARLIANTDRNDDSQLRLLCNAQTGDQFVGAQIFNDHDLFQRMQRVCQ
jgi:hypothetical protein